MGWDGMQNDGVRRDARGHIARVLGEEAAERTLAAERVGDVIYAAYWSAEDVVSGLVILIDRPRGGWTYYKVMDETMGPNEAKCPEGILDTLDATDDHYANEWRSRCRRAIRQAKLLEQVG